MFIGYRVISVVMYCVSIIIHVCMIAALVTSQKLPVGSLKYVVADHPWFDENPVNSLISSDEFGHVWTHSNHKAKDCLVPVSRLVLSACAYVLICVHHLLVN